MKLRRRNSALPWDGRLRRLAVRTGKTMAAATVVVAAAAPFAAQGGNLIGTPPTPSPRMLEETPYLDVFEGRRTQALLCRVQNPQSISASFLGVTEVGDEGQWAQDCHPDLTLVRRSGLEVISDHPDVQRLRDTYLHRMIGEEASKSLFAFISLDQRGLLLDEQGQPRALLRELVALHDAALHPSVDARAVLAEVTQDVAAPFIFQTRRGVCMAGVGAQYLALKHPAEYVRLMHGLASPEGRVTTVSGTTLTREDDAFTAPALEGIPWVQKLLLPALMEKGNGVFGYQSSGGFRQDQWTLGPVPLGFTGLEEHQVERLLEELTGDSFTAKNDLFGRSFDARTELEQALQRATRGEPTLIRWALPDVGLAEAGLQWWGLGGHGAVVLGEDEEGTVRLLDPWGAFREVPFDELAERLDGVVYRDLPPHEANGRMRWWDPEPQYTIDPDPEPLIRPRLLHRGGVDR